MFRRTQLKKQMAANIVEPPIDHEPIKIHLLAQRKAWQKPCEMCGVSSSLMCAQCKSAFYCSLTHFNMDKELHLSICDRLKVVCAPDLSYHDADTRVRLKKQLQFQLQELCAFTFSRSKAAMDSGDFERAIRSVKLAIKYAPKAYKEKQMWIPPLLVAAECFAYLGRLKQVEMLLSQAQFIERGQSEIKPAIRASIYRVEGLMYLAKDNLMEARYSFSQEICWNSEAYGPVDIRTSSGYCYLGSIFLGLGEYLIAASMLRHTVQIWMDFLEPVTEELYEDVANRNQMVGQHVFSQAKEYMPKRELYEGLRTVRKTLGHLQEIPRSLQQPIDTIRAFYVISALHMLIGQHADSWSAVQEAMTLIEKWRVQDSQILHKLNQVDKHSSRHIFLNKSGRFTSDSINPMA